MSEAPHPLASFGNNADRVLFETLIEGLGRAIGPKKTRRLLSEMARSLSEAADTLHVVSIRTTRPEMQASADATRAAVLAFREMLPRLLRKVPVS